ncbi:thermonuclease family protein [Fulvivirga lutea]|uniref:Thermonuclease family protein n=1 Tax=Fulvivirga lutea TaxID=2810512 RepID=A0A974WJW4_9BACT|nr:thermonuclease family protein [Fulvivirga lutea]QSE98557.1 thermonuclease family protein [Fulvivirga lutea]
MIRRVSTVLFSLITVIASAQTYDQDFTGKVVNVIDGNTIEVENENDEVIKFILSEVDCPEPGQTLSEEAKAFTEDLILKKKVQVELKGKDWLGNRLAVITLKNGTVLHEELLKEGLAWADRKASSTSSNLEASAKAKKIGLWTENEPTPPWIYRRQQTMMQAKSR